MRSKIKHIIKHGLWAVLLMQMLFMTFTTPGSSTNQLEVSKTSNHSSDFSKILETLLSIALEHETERSEEKSEKQSGSSFEIFELYYISMFGNKDLADSHLIEHQCYYYENLTLPHLEHNSPPPKLG